MSGSYGTDARPSATAGPSLSPEHRALLKASAISDDVITERGYWTATKTVELERLGFRRNTATVPALVIPSRGPDGLEAGYQVRPSIPPVVDGRVAKYLSPPGAGVVLDVPPRCRPLIGSVQVPLWVTEGVKKADALATAGLCAVGLLGVDAFKCEEWGRVALSERRVYVAYDSDVMRKRSVHGALQRITGYLEARGAELEYAYLPEQLPGVGGKVGVDDFLAAGHTVEDLYALAEKELREPPPEEKPKRAAALPTAHLLAMIAKLFRRFVRFPSEHEPVALALFVMHSYALEAAQTTPYVVVESPEKRSGKTRALEVAELVVHEPLRAANITAAGVFQAIEKWTPTLLVDECDAVFRAKSEAAEALRGVLNAGNRRGSFVVRGSQDGEPQRFATFCPKVLAGINTGRLPDTIRDRSIVLSMKRRRPGEDIEDLFPGELEEQLAELHRRLEDWAAENVEQLAGWRRRERVAGLDDRLQEAWDPLLAIADLAQAGWPEKSRRAATALAEGAQDAGDATHGHVLIEALREIFGGAATLASRTICGKLNESEELPFGGYSDGKGIAPRDLAKLLKPYGIKPKAVWVEDKTVKGYHREQLAEAWERYTPRADPSEKGQEGQEGQEPNAHGASDLTDLTPLTSFGLPSRGAHMSSNGASPDRAPALCQNPAHRGSDWALPAGEMWICGVCHPPAVAGIVHRNGKGPPA